MKKVLFSAILMMMALTASAQLQYKLVRYYDSTEEELVEYIYDTNYRLIAIHTLMDGPDGYDVIDSVFYNDNGDMIKICGWQLFYDEQTYEPYRRWVNYVDYTYDSEHRITSRKNYNDFDGWTLGGEYTFTYDTQGRLAKRTLLFAGFNYEEVNYSYTDGKVTEEVWNTDYEMTGHLSPYEKITYIYNEDGALIQAKDSTYDGSAYTAYLRHDYSYENGNCSWHKTFNASGNETERNVYTYCEKLKSETLMPHTPEQDIYPNRPKNTAYNTNVYTSEEYWGLDVNWHLQHLSDYTYEYIGINESGVEDVTDDNVIREYRNVRKVLIDGQIYIECGERMFDMNGRRVK